MLRHLQVSSALTELHRQEVPPLQGWWLVGRHQVDHHLHNSSTGPGEWVWACLYLLHSFNLLYDWIFSPVAVMFCAISRHYWPIAFIFLIRSLRFGVLPRLLASALCRSRDIHLTSGWVNGARWWDDGRFLLRSVLTTAVMRFAFEAKLIKSKSGLLNLLPLWGLLLLQGKCRYME